MAAQRRHCVRAPLRVLRTSGPDVGKQLPRSPCLLCAHFGDMQLRGNRVALVFGASEYADREMYCALPPSKKDVLLIGDLLRDLGYHVFQLLDPTQGQLAEGQSAPLAFESLTAFGRCLHHICMLLCG